ncbi:MAG: winged helix-turn-helix transcriptional regulator [Colwellia sp.]|nr:winged helix-turn-helix transcriptional regulator [Colwellia sp.]
MIDIQQPFKLANITITPTTDELSFDGKTIEIKSMAMKVICYFAIHKDEIISRDSLRENVWQNSTASNHTINNHIYSLRQTLAKLDPDTKFFHTVTGSKSGYRLVAAITQESALSSPSSAVLASTSISANATVEAITNQQIQAVSPISGVSFQKSQKVVYLKTIILTVLLFVLSVSIYFFSADKQYNHITPLSQQPGREQSPAISQDGQIIIYANRVSRGETWELYASKMQLPLQPIKIFTTSGNRDNFVSISPNKKYIAFLRYAKGETGIYIADFNSQRLTARNEKLLIPLNAANLSPAISWLSNSQFFYTATEAVSAPLKVYLYDLALDRSEQISAPALNTFGDMSVVVSPNNKLLAIMRSDNFDGHQLYLYDLASKNLIKTEVKSTEVRLNISFSDDSKQVFYVDQQGFLSSYSIEAQVIKQISQQQYIGYWPLKVPNKNQFIMQQDWGLSSLTTQIIKINNPQTGGDGTSETIVSNGLSIRSIAGIDNGLIFASIKANQQLELWKYQNGKTNKLEEFNEKAQYRYPLSLSWLKGSNKALLSINKSCRIIDIITGKDTPLCPDNENLYAGNFSYDGQHIYLAGFDNNGDKAVKIGISGFPLTPLKQLKSANSIQQDAHGNFYYSQEPNYDIYFYQSSTGENRKIIERTYINNRYSVNDFVTTEKGIYFMDRVRVGSNAIYYYNFSDQKTSYLIKSHDNYPNIVLSEDEQFIYLIKSFDNDSKLLLVE